MAQNVIINGVTYQSVPEVDIPKSGGGTAKFFDTAGADAQASHVLSGKKFFGATGEDTGTIASKVATSYLPSRNDQVVNSGQYLAGNQTFKGVTTENLSSQYIANGVTVKVGCASDDDCIASVTGTLQSPTISQDSTTKVLSIS